jgi:SAM-dependent methyltransferase
VEVLAELAGDGAALELGIGTGRIALPLAARGVPVYEIDLSEAMLARLRTKPGGAEMPVALGDFSTTRVDGRFSLAYVVFNTIINLRTQEAQVACFENVAAHHEPGGCFVVEIMLPELQRLSPGERFLPSASRPTTSASTSTTSRARASPHITTTQRPVPTRLSPADTSGHRSST